MARNDLEQMRTGRIDPQGRGKTDMGRVKALVGVILTLLCGLFFVLFFVELFH
jgi:hypothetical protein